MALSKRQRFFFAEGSATPPHRFRSPCVQWMLYSFLPRSGRGCEEMWSSSVSTHIVLLTQLIKALVPVFPDTKNRMKQTKLLHASQGEYISLQRENLILNPRMSPLVCPIDSAIASQKSQGRNSAQRFRCFTGPGGDSACQTIAAGVGDANDYAGLQTAVCNETPLFDTVLSSHMEESSPHILKEEISTVLMKGAIRMVPSSLINQGFNSCYFLVPKKDALSAPSWTSEC